MEGSKYVSPTNSTYQGLALLVNIQGRGCEVQPPPKSKATICMPSNHVPKALLDHLNVSNAKWVGGGGGSARLLWIKVRLILDKHLDASWGGLTYMFY